MECGRSLALISVALAKANIPHRMMSKWRMALTIASLELLGGCPSEPWGQGHYKPTSFHLDYLIKK